MKINQSASNTSAHQQADDASLRKSSQFLMPFKLTGTDTSQDEYNIYPVCSLGKNKIFTGYDSLAQYIADKRTVLIDGYVGVSWDKIQAEINKYFTTKGLTANWINTCAYLKAETAIEALLCPFLGTPDAVWGTKCTLSLSDLFQLDKLTAQLPDEQYDINIIIGTGATLSGWNVPVIYIDLPKNELQFRMRAGSVTNLGACEAHEPFYMYKRFYFVDWVLLNAHKKYIIEQIAVIVDGQWPDNINWMHKTDFAAGLNHISNSVIRVRPWFEPGAWGGHWIREHIKNINKDVVNYAWSFELIVPENGLIFESDGYLLEASFDFLMFHNRNQVLGNHAEQFGDEFPIRFDFLDTFDGGNLSIQCHPKLKYIQDNFGETITQDETYYILDCKDKARVYLGFQENMEPKEFRAVLEESQAGNKEVKIENYVQAHAARKHDLFLIPNGTVHSAGVNNLVLEISATPYIFTFKMYDWLRLDLDGNPRPINIDHAFNNLDFSRKGDRVRDELISKPSVIQQGNDWQLVHLPTHAEHFYDIHRMEFDKDFTVETDNRCHVMMLVEGSAISIKTANGTEQVFAYAETFVVPAAAISYTLTNLGKKRAKVIKAFLK
ncbi:class I mannose-6-phosphate isomerase [Mucilaginibacter pocheonensis]|uniref:Mannose-6-phosphate isomerase class I n=1 Tax=Mucilaginibacter pocheonensis TaxID=398050 RepID=A0ABU1TJE0_9SPHI|nr:class I mannose-6-phosphate isomerase [Mucilaginibacter pocheonensis]MDR6945386.1 mannose-6-phosphate isomerase class I [Mucilaginibacter pocheonensis]